jgi:hypothetical protein
MSRRHKDNLVGALLVLCVATPIVWWTGDTAKKTDTTAETLARQQEGRKVAIEVLCGFASAVSDAGRKTIAGSVALPRPHEAGRGPDRARQARPVIGLVSGRFGRFLEAHGYPLAPQRLTGSRRLLRRTRGTCRRGGGGDAREGARESGRDARLRAVAEGVAREVGRPPGVASK